MPKPSKQTAFSLALNEITVDETATVREMAQVIGCSVSHMRKVVSTCDTTQLSLDKAIRLSHWLVQEKDETRQLYPADDAGLRGLLGDKGEAHFRPEDWENDDNIRRDIMAARQDAARAIEAFDKGDVDEAARHLRKSIADMMTALQDAQEPAG